jgi:hypothetical protein
MGEFIQYHVRAERDTSDSGPSLGAVGDELCIAWRGAGDKVNVMPVIIGSDGGLAFDVDRKLVTSECVGGPALCQAEAPHQLVLAWALNNPDGELNSIIGLSLDERFETIRELVSFDWTDLTPAGPSHRTVSTSRPRPASTNRLSAGGRRRTGSTSPGPGRTTR